MADKELNIRIKAINEASNALRETNKQLADLRSEYLKTNTSTAEGAARVKEIDMQYKVLNNTLVSTKTHFKELTQNMSGTKSGFSGLQSSMSGIGNLMKGFIGFEIVKSIGEKIFNFGKDSIKAFNEANIASEKLKQGLSNVGDSKSFEKLKNQAEEFSKTTIFSAKEIMNAQAMLSTFKLNGAEIEKLTPRILDMASAFEKTGKGQEDLQQLAMFIGKATGGEMVKGLQRRGVIFTPEQLENFKQAKTRMEEVDIVAKVLDDNFNGMAERLGGTFAGRVQIMHHAFEQMKEKIGGALSEGLLPFVQAIQGAMPFIESIVNLIIAFGKEVGRYITALVGGTGGTKQFTDTIKSLIENGLKYLFDIIRNQILPAFSNMYKAIHDLITQHPELIQGIGLVVAGFMSLWGFVLKVAIAIDTTLIKVLNKLISVYETVYDWLSKIYNYFAKPVPGSWAEGVRNEIEKVYNTIKGAIDWIDGMKNSLAFKILFPQFFIGDTQPEQTPTDKPMNDIGDHNVPLPPGYDPKHPYGKDPISDDANTKKGSKSKGETPEEKELEALKEYVKKQQEAISNEKILLDNGEATKEQYIAVYKTAVDNLQVEYERKHLSVDNQQYITNEYKKTNTELMNLNDSLNKEQASKILEVNKIFIDGEKEKVSAGKLSTSVLIENITDVLTTLKEQQAIYKDLGNDGKSAYEEISKAIIGYNKESEKAKDDQDNYIKSLKEQNQTIKAGLIKDPYEKQMSTISQKYTGELDKLEIELTKEKNQAIKDLIKTKIDLTKQEQAQELQQLRLSKATNAINLIVNGATHAFSSFFSTLQNKGSVGEAFKQMLKGIGNSVISFVEGLFLAARAKAIADSVLSFGASLVKELPEIIGGVALLETAKAALNSFSVGGYTGDYPTNQIVGAVHGGEYVLPNSMSSLFPALEAIRTGGTLPSSNSINIAQQPIYISANVPIDKVLRTGIPKHNKIQMAKRY